MVGSKRFPESYILGETITQLANSARETQAIHKQGLGNTGIVFAALKTGNIDIYPEYTGTVALELLKDKTVPDLAELNKELAPMGLSVGVPLGFNDTYALAMREDEAQKLDIQTISDLAKHPDLHFGLSQEFLKRADGWPGLKTAYNLPFSTPQGFDHEAAYVALTGGQIDVLDVYSTDAEIEKYKLRVLQDDRHYFPAYDAVLIYRSDLPARLPKTWDALQKLQGTIPNQQMVEMNDAALNKQSFPSIAANFLADKLHVGQAEKAGEETFWQALVGSGSNNFWTLTGEHLYLVFISLLLGVLIGVPLGIWSARSRSAAPIILSLAGLLQTIPSLALFAFLIPIVHTIGAVPAIIALFLYSLLPIVRNTYTGLTDISPALRESAVALGLPSFARLTLIELPLAARSIFAGIKTSAVINVGTATIAAFIGAGGYGERISAGLATNDNVTLLAGAIPAAALALIIQGLFDLLDRLVVPAGLRKAAAQRTS
jgi:osmoprotectant transport system permease protein